MVETISQLIGFAGTIVSFIMFQQNKRRRIIGCQILSTSLFAIHYILLGAFTGAALNAIAITRSIVFYNNDKKWAKSPVWLWFYIVVSIVAGLLTWESWYSILPAIALVLTTVANWMKSETKIRLISFPNSPCWLIYNAITGSVAGVITECIVMSSLIIGIVRYDILKKGKKKNEN